MRKRDEWFCRKLVVRLAAGEEFLSACREAALDAWRFDSRMRQEFRDRQALARAQDALRNPDIQERFTTLFSIGGFEVTDAVKIHVDHIRKGNYAALKDYWNMTQPKPARQIDIRQAVVHVDAETFREPKAITPRILSATQTEGNTHE